MSLWLERSFWWAPNPSPDEIAAYEVDLPSRTWPDDWAGERFERSNRVHARDLEQRDKLNIDKPLLMQPTLETLPVYVRGDSIVPVEAVMQNIEKAALAADASHLPGHRSKDALYRRGLHGQ